MSRQGDSDIVKADDSKPEWLGGQGAPTDAHVRESLRLIHSAVKNQWDIPSEWKNALPRLCLKIALDENKGDRERLRATEILRAMSRDNLDALQVLDKIERLDGGEATERIELAPITWKPNGP
tara:strand:+ start:318 stop:686 length:369 start_codon:yes stop_codon:yes gene_type:complete